LRTPEDQKATEHNNSREENDSVLKIRKELEDLKLKKKEEERRKREEKEQNERRLNEEEERQREKDELKRQQKAEEDLNKKQVEEARVSELERVEQQERQKKEEAKLRSVQQQKLEGSWRPIGVADPWSQQEYEKLKEQIRRHKIIEEAGLEHINVLLVGEPAAVKSSFFNSVESVFEGFVSSTAEAGTDEETMTKQFRMYEIDTVKFKYCDTTGVESTCGLTTSDFGKIMDGHIMDTADLSGSNLMLVPGAPGYNPRPTESDRMHCVAIVISAPVVSIMDPTMDDKLRARRQKQDTLFLSSF